MKEHNSTIYRHACFGIQHLIEGGCQPPPIIFTEALVEAQETFSFQEVEPLLVIYPIHFIFEVNLRENHVLFWLIISAKIVQKLFRIKSAYY